MANNKGGKGGGMSFEDELRLDEEENLREVEFIPLSSCLLISRRSIVSPDILWIMDAIVDYYYTSGILESNDEEVDIDMEAVAEYVCQKAVSEGVSKSFNPEEVFFIVQADLDFQEQNL